MTWRQCNVGTLNQRVTFTIVHRLLNVLNKLIYQVKARVFSYLEAVQQMNVCRDSAQGCVALRRQSHNSPFFQLNKQTITATTSAMICHISNCFKRQHSSQLHRHLNLHFHFTDHCHMKYGSASFLPNFLYLPIAE